MDSKKDQQALSSTVSFTLISLSHPIDRANIRNKSVSSIGKSETSFKTQTQSFGGKTSVLSSMATTLANVDSAILCGHYKGVKVAVKPINVPKLNITRENLIEFKHMRDVIHNNLVNFVGMVVEDTNAAIVSELCVRGSLKGRHLMLAFAFKTLTRQFRKFHREIARYAGEREDHDRLDVQV